MLDVRHNHAIMQHRTCAQMSWTHAIHAGHMAESCNNEAYGVLSEVLQVYNSVILHKLQGMPVAECIILKSYAGCMA